MDSADVVRADSGEIRGYRVGGLFVFAGIPYAEPPAGPNRFLPPKPVQPWHGVFDAVKFGPVAPQPPSIIPTFPPEQSEAGCLTLNIWTPNVDDKKRSVLFWIHGGGMLIGSGAIDSRGQKLTERGDVVLVSINYRLGVFGFLCVPGKTANVGLLDQVEALKWVNRNISHFGGDPENVTVFGESAGATSISALMTMPLARGLFKRAVMQSGGCATYAQTFKLAGGEVLSQRVFSIAGIRSGDLEALRAVPAPELMTIYQKATGGIVIGETSPPYVDGEVIRDDPLEAVKRGVARDIELMAGFNENELSIFSAMPQAVEGPAVALGVEKDSKGIEELHQLIAYWLQRIRPFTKDKNTTQELARIYVNEHGNEAFNTLRHAREQFLTDLCMRIPNLLYLEGQSKHQPRVYAYMFAWKTPEFGGTLGAVHSLEIPFVFGNLRDKPVSIYPARTPETDKVSTDMMDAWINFARHGDPSHGNIPRWPAFKAEIRPTMVFDTVTRVETNLFSERNKAWMKIIQPPFDTI